MIWGVTLILVIWGLVLSCARQTLLALARDHLLPHAREHLFPLALNHLLPFARKHLFPRALDHVLPILKESFNMIRGVPNDEIIAHMKHELETIEEAIHQADKMADAEDNQSDGTREKIKQLIEAFFHIQDVIDEYIIRKVQQLPDLGCVDCASDFVKTKMLRFQIAHDIQIIKSQINEMKDKSAEIDEGLQIKSSTEQGSCSSGVNTNAMSLQKLRKAPFDMEEADVVGFEEPKKILIDWLIKGEAERTVVSVFAMGGQGKTTLAKQVFDNPQVVKDFNCRVWITVSQQYNAEKLLRDMVHQLHKEIKGSNPPETESINQMNRDSLIDEVRNCLLPNRYVVVFDDVWNKHFWDEIEFAMIDNKNGSRVIITTRDMLVVNACRDSSLVKDYELKPLTKEKSLELFNKKAFYDLKGSCPGDLVDISSKIVNKCDGLPLAVVVTGGLLSRINRVFFEWNMFNTKLNLELKKDSNIDKILVVSYHDLSYNLKSCLLYFGIYPEDYKVNSKKLIRQWIAEGFVKEEEGKTLEEVAQGYLIELIHRSLVQVVSVSVDGRAKYCRVHDMVHAMILKKFKHLSFFKNINDDGQSTLTGITRRLSVTTNSDNFMESINISHVRSLFYINTNLSKSSLKKISTKCKLLKVLVVEGDEEPDLPEDLGSLIYLKHLEWYMRKPYGFGNHYARCYTIPIPKSIGMLENLETLVLSGGIFKLPKEICKLRKLRHLTGYEISLIELKDDIGGLESLQTLLGVYLREKDKNDDRVIDLIKELRKLKQLRELVLKGVDNRYLSALSSSINKMQLLQKLSIAGLGYYCENIYMDLNSPPPMLRHLQLIGKLKKLPKWIPQLENLVKLKLSRSEIEGIHGDIMEQLKSMPNLLTLSLKSNALLLNEGFNFQLHFKDGWFMNLKQLIINDVDDLYHFLYDDGALPSLEKLYLLITENRLKREDFGRLKKLKDLHIYSYDLSE